ncbi:MAG: arylesterase [Bacteroidia bacterium]
MRICHTGLAVSALVIWLYACNPTGTPRQQPQATTADTTATSAAASMAIIMFFGNSLTYGYGLDDPAQAFPARIQARIDSLGLAYRVVNAGISGETTADGLSRIGWTLRQPIDIFVLELGGNDGLRGLPPEQTRQNLQAIIDSVRQAQPQTRILLTGMMAPPNMGADYTRRFREVYPALAKENDIAFLPFLLEGVAGEPQLNQADGIHPTAEGHEIVSAHVWTVLREML